MVDYHTIIWYQAYRVVVIGGNTTFFNTST
jgi:hypothetical protein